MQIENKTKSPKRKTETRISETHRHSRVRFARSQLLAQAFRDGRHRVFRGAVKMIASADRNPMTRHATESQPIRARSEKKIFLFSFSMVSARSIDDRSVKTGAILSLAGNYGSLNWDLSIHVTHKQEKSFFFNYIL